MANHIIDQDMMSSVQEILQSDYLRESNVLNLLPSAVYVCDRSGIIVSYKPGKESKLLFKADVFEAVLKRMVMLLIVSVYENSHFYLLT